MTWGKGYAFKKKKIASYLVCPLPQTEMDSAEKNDQTSQHLSQMNVPISDFQTEIRQTLLDNTKCPLMLKAQTPKYSSYKIVLSLPKMFLQCTKLIKSLTFTCDLVPGFTCCHSIQLRRNICRIAFSVKYCTSHLFVRYPVLHLKLTEMGENGF